ncbi:hypothetical protein D047_4897A, partial [Vibrio parahaemolyticus VPTS-2010_2]
MAHRWQREKVKQRPLLQQSARLLSLYQWFSRHQDPPQTVHLCSLSDRQGERSLDRSTRLR